MYTNERCLIFDESGNLGQNGRYFVISCIDTTNAKSLHNIIKNKLKIAKKKFPELNIHSHEIKASEAHPCVKYHILESIISKDITVSYIVADLQYVEPNLLIDKNIFYNFIMKILIDKLVKDNDKNTKLNIISDNKVTKITSKNSFTDYIKIWLNYERRLNMDINVEYKDSNDGSAYIIQAADYVANAVYSYYEHSQSIHYNIVGSKLNIVEEFPRDKFGK